MSRIKISESPAPHFDEDLYEASPGPSYPRRTANNEALSPSPAASTSSNKENRSSRIPIDKGKGRALNVSMGPPRAPSPTSKRKRTGTTGEGDTSIQRNQRRRTTEVDEDEDDAQEYDPDQSVEERRQLRFELRGLSRTLQNNRAEYLNPESTGIKDTLLKANKLSERVKQTCDATIDSRLLVSTADLAKKKTLRMTSGDTVQGVDVDDFVSKIKLYMANKPLQASQGHTPRNTQRSRRNEAIDGEDSDNDNDGEMLNWEHLGHHACLPNNARPSVPGFLLGPLSLQKRARRAIVRRAPLRPSNLQETRPEVLRADDIEKSENANLTYLCSKILFRLKEVQIKSIAAAEEETTEEMTEEEGDALRDRYGLSENELMAYFKFVINPFSFGQTIENMFYVSFLVRDGQVQVEIDPDGLPYIGARKEEGNGSSSHTARHQAVLSLDMNDWQEMIELFDIKEPMIDHREERDNSNIGAKGWYA
ncbi:hypothetical protein SBOR_10007 [Sclerotinia borealis F-4128]|uniref:Non-structural maintenance of chromosomes element 4 n=1 Tax=Sclerotinia borealis (strain F-4128) TaxID=1432307 RepID=W9C3V2_SCLBF|nr:hypothetical protein SBOR_10007 [Sclerotinia borealis F-4128]